MVAMRTLFVGLCVISCAFALNGDVLYTYTNASHDPLANQNTLYPTIVWKPASAGANAPESVVWQYDCYNSNPRFSYDKFTVVFASALAYNTPTPPPTLTLLYTIPADNNGNFLTPRRVTDLDQNDYNEFAADWSPDDTEFVIEYTWHSGNAGSSEDATRLGTVLSNDTTSFVPLMQNLHATYNDWCARWNPKNSDYILFLSDRNGFGDVGIFLYDFKKHSATVFELPHELPATSNCPFWDQDGNSFYYEVHSYEGKYPFMAQVHLDAPAIAPVPKFRIDYVDTPSASGVPEYIQCTTGPSSGYFSCLKSGPDGDSIVILNDHGELVQNVTTTDRNRYHATPNWK